MDAFGLIREQKINESGVREIFTPHQPIQSLDLFFGRRSEVQRLIEHLNTPGQHALLFGNRGVGKSSLANISSELLLQKVSGGNFIKKECDSTDTFLSIVSKPLAQVGIDTSEISAELTMQTSGKGGLEFGGLKLGAERSSGDRSTITGTSYWANSPDWVADKIKDLQGLFLIDEFDSLTNDEDKWKVAELIKKLSDKFSSLKIFVVGIGDTAVELTAGHESVQRCLKETPLHGMNFRELQEIITSGQERIGVTFESRAIFKICKVSSKYPHFTHLLALKASEDAIAKDKETVTLDDLEAATKRAVEDAEGTMKAAYDAAVRSANSPEYRKILLAAAVCSQEEIPAKNLRQSYEEIWGQTLTQGALNNYLRGIISDYKTDTILRRLAKGVYRFNDPRMPSYIRIAERYLPDHS